MLVIEQTIAAGVKRARNPTPDALDNYHARKLLGQGQDNQRRYDAGSRLRESWDQTRLSPHVISRYTDLISHGSVQGRPLSNLTAYRNYSLAIMAVSPIARPEILAVCCWGEAVGRDRMEILRRGLEELAAHYGY